MAINIGNILLESSVSYGFGLRGPDGCRTGEVFFSTCTSSSSSFSSDVKEGSSGTSKMFFFSLIIYQTINTLTGIRF